MFLINKYIYLEVFLVYIKFLKYFKSYKFAKDCFDIDNNLNYKDYFKFKENSWGLVMNDFQTPIRAYTSRKCSWKQ